MPAHSAMPQEWYRSQQDGFTLAEVLVALALLAAMSLLMLQALSGSARITGIAQQQLQRQEVVRVRSFLRHALASAMPVPLPGGERNLLLHGEQHAMAFTTGHTVPAQFAGFHVTRLYLKPAKGGGRGLHDLWMEQFPSGFRDEVPAALIVRRRLLENVRAVQFRYLLQHANGEVEWVYQWKVENRLPKLIAMKIFPSYDDPGFWPELIVYLRVAP